MGDITWDIEDTVLHITNDGVNYGFTLVVGKNWMTWQESYPLRRLS